MLTSTRCPAAGRRNKVSRLAHTSAIDLSGDVTGNGISKLVFSILSAVVEAERDGRCERIHEVKRDQKAGKRYLGGIVPFG
jgi:putative DNA-invertase from lambdoid prophage Rac